ncbi:hypothetical protein ACFQ0K_05995 [Nocardioides caeni]|uniref:Secreted protein n=1 Tax=Nocardioides caeni TaxID=574700 RepID=A0A4S8NAQ3_9ACTN|nr:hypothetical protein [Nocardioides caeni]THV13001.1 hypothetical protein E9934_11580 [Nocardioides caeni]
MRFTRILTALIAAFTAVMLSFTMGSSAQAAPVADGPVATKVAKPKHTFTRLKADETRREGVFYVQARLTSNPGQRVWLRSWHRSTNRWRNVKSVITRSDTGGFKMTFAGRCGTRFRLYAAETASFARTEVYIGAITCS